MLMELGRKPIEIMEKLEEKIELGLDDLEVAFAEYMEAGYLLNNVGTGYFDEDADGHVYLVADNGGVGFYTIGYNESVEKVTDLSDYPVEVLIDFYKAIVRARDIWINSIKRVSNEAEDLLT